MNIFKINDNSIFLNEYLYIIKGNVVNIDFHKLESLINMLDDSKEKRFNNYEYIDKRFDKKKLKLNYIYPNSAGICLTDLCQFRCNYCSFSSSDKGRTLEYDSVRVFVDYIFRNAILRQKISNNIEYVSFYFAGGGEPTLNFELLKKCVLYIRTKEKHAGVKAYINMTTNGYLNNEQLEFISENLDYVLVSFDGNEYFQNQNRKVYNGEKSFDVVDNTIKYLMDKNIIVELRSTIWLKDFEKIKDMYLFIINRYSKIRNWDIEPVAPIGRAKFNADFKSSNNKLDNYKLSSHYIALKEYIYDHNLPKILTCGKFKDSKVDFLCGTILGFNPWLITNNKVVTCLDAKDKATLLGTISNGNIILNEYYDLNAEIFMNNIEKCKSCFAFPFCGSGCPLKNSSDEYSYASNWECNEIKKYWEIVLNHLVENEKYIGWELEKLNIDTSDEFSIYKIKRSDNYENYN